MKYLEYTPLDRINDFLSHVNFGERTIKGCLTLANVLEQIRSYPSVWRMSRKMLIYLILTLYHMYPDYDFSAVKAHQFFTEETWDNFKQIFDAYMFDASKNWAQENEGSSLLDTFYNALDEVVKLAECEIYSYNPDSDADPFLERGAIWAFNFFFYNRKLKRVVCFCFSCISNLVAEGLPMDGICYEEDGEIFDEMDM